MPESEKRPTVGKSENKTDAKRTYEFGVSKDNATLLTWLPPALMLMGVLGIGCGVWVVRRR